MVKELVQPSVPRHHRAILSGALGIFASLLAIAWALFGYNLPAALRLSATQAQNLMLTQVTIAFVTLVAGGLMISRYPRAGGGLLIIGSMATFIIGIFYTRALELANRSGFSVATSSIKTKSPITFLGSSVPSRRTSQNLD